MELAPGQEAVLHFDIDLHHRTGPQRFVCRLMEEAGEEWTYELGTTLYEHASFSEPGPIHFGMVDPNATAEFEMTLRTYAASAAELPTAVAFTTDSDCLRLEPRPAPVDEPVDGIVTRTFPLRLRFRAPATPGFGQAAIQAQFAWHGENRSIGSAANWNVRTLFTVSPPQVYFGTVDASGLPIERKVSLRRTDGLPVTVKTVKVSSPAVRGSVCEGDGAPEARLVFVLNPEGMRTPLVGEAIVETDHPVERDVKILFAAVPKRSES
jgi:hypothetical protein